MTVHPKQIINRSGIHKVNPRADSCPRIYTIPERQKRHHAAKTQTTNTQRHLAAINTRLSAPTGERAEKLSKQKSYKLRRRQPGTSTLSRKINKTLQFEKTPPRARNKSQIKLIRVVLEFPRKRPSSKQIPRQISVTPVQEQVNYFKKPRKNLRPRKNLSRTLHPGTQNPSRHRSTRSQTSQSNATNSTKVNTENEREKNAFLSRT